MPEFDKDFYNMVNADVIRNKEIQKITGKSPAQEAWKAANNLPHKKGLTLWERFKIWLYDITYQRELKSEYDRGFRDGRDFELRTIVQQANDDYETALKRLDAAGQ